MLFSVFSRYERSTLCCRDMIVLMSEFSRTHILVIALQSSFTSDCTFSRILMSLSWEGRVRPWLVDEGPGCSQSKLLMLEVVLMSLDEVIEVVDVDILALELLICRSCDMSTLLDDGLGLPNISSSIFAHFSLLSSFVMVMSAGVILGGITVFGGDGRMALYRGTLGFCTEVLGG